VPGLPHGKDPSAEDLSTEDPRALDDAHVNNFDYSQDADGINVPRAAHIRKVNPRSTALPDGDASNRHRLIRRGIPYGPAFQPGESPYGAVVPPEQDRGLLFACYQASITDGFEFVQRAWANSANFQAQGDGEDPIVSQDNDPRPFHLPTQKGPVDLSFAQWVRTTGGGYYFSPSISAIEALSQQPSNSGKTQM
jgi:deferrochelatase/peroxidase EfeB